MKDGLQTGLPELMNSRPYDPFKTYGILDIYGILFRKVNTF